MSGYILSLEAIGDAQQAHHRAYAGTLRQLAPEVGRLFDMPSRRPWVAEIVDCCPIYGFQRIFLGSKKDYARANSIGSRGVYLHFTLQEDYVYEVHALLSWKRSERYFCQIRDGQPVRLSRQEVIRCLSEG